MRAFIAADIPEDILERLSEAALAFGLSGIRVVDKSNMHFTLAFLGELENSRIDNVKNAISRVHFDMFDVDIKGIDYFGNPGAIYSAVDLGADKIIELANAIRAELASLDIYFDKKDFVPHVTIARMKRRVDEKVLIDELHRFADKGFGSYTLDKISLFKSVLSTDRPRYEGLYERKARGT
jgi:2'-5' RNA ligase